MVSVRARPVSRPGHTSAIGRRGTRRWGCNTARGLSRCYPPPQVANERVVTEDDLSRVGVTADGDFNLQELSEFCNRCARARAETQSGAWRRPLDTARGNVRAGHGARPGRGGVLQA